MAEQLHLLIVHNERQVREVLHQIFVASGYNCLLANDGRAGLEAFSRHAHRMEQVGPYRPCKDIVRASLGAAFVDFAVGVSSDDIEEIAESIKRMGPHAESPAADRAAARPAGTRSDPPAPRAGGSQCGRKGLQVRRSAHAARGGCLAGACSERLEAAAACR
jgi:CheY-like chemotaxis protein